MNSIDKYAHGEKAMVIDVERFAINDGPGIRTTVFLKGCPLRCIWCGNPESQTSTRQIMFSQEQCTGCGKCITTCKQKAIEISEEYGLSINTKCNLCGECIDACIYNARSFVGKVMTVEEIYDEVMKDYKYFASSKGGVTFSGGEPMLHADFISKVSKKLHKAGVNVLIETCGLVPYEDFKKIIDDVDYIYYDVKLMDTDAHKKYTGAGNETILNNLVRLNKEFKGKITVRYPYITGINSKKEQVISFLEFVDTLDNVDDVEFLPYHRLGMPKYKGLSREYELKDLKPLTKNDLKPVLEYGKKYRVDIKINV